MILSRRLETLISFVRPGFSAADIGTDHGFVPIELVSRGICPRALAMDVRPGPLSAAREHIRERRLEDRIETRLSDGLECLLPGETDAILMAGMGGSLMLSLITAAPDKARSARRLIVSPQSEHARFREGLYRAGFLLVRETDLWEDDKYYVIMEAVPGEAKLPSPAELAYGPLLLAGRSPALKVLLGKELRRISRVLDSLAGLASASASQKREELQKKEALLRQAMAYYGEESFDEGF